MSPSKLATYPSLADRGVFITGGATGIGAAFTEAFVRSGAKVAFVDVDDVQAEALVGGLEAEFGRTVWFRRVDITIAAELEAAVHDASAALGGLHVLVNNAASDERHGVEECDIERWRRCMALNLDAAYVAARAAFAKMKGGGQGTIINLGSINALLGPAGMPGYVTAKAGIMGLTKALARDFGPHGVRVNAILPGWVATERQLAQWLTPEVELDWSRQVSLKRRLLPADVANLALFLAADDSEMITGQNFIIDAGRT
jgi:NAD(P)-dependent dehydrogenase (short-subunit alcohol dehydrogenase family)